MSEAEHLADALRGLFSNPQHGWFTPISVSIQGINAQQAATTPRERFNSVWAIVNHLRFWQDFVRLRLQGQEVDREALGAENGWPAIPRSITQQEWEKSYEQVLRANEELADLVATLSDHDLARPYAEGRALRSQLVHGVISHNCYHSCEIVSVRHMLGLWLERS